MDFTKVVQLASRLGGKSTLVWSMAVLDGADDDDIFSALFNKYAYNDIEIYRTSRDNPTLQFKLNIPNVSTTDEIAYLAEVNLLLTQLYDGLRELAENEENEGEKRLFVWNNEYFMSRNIYKVYMYVWFDRHYIYNLFGCSCKCQHIATEYNGKSVKQLVDDMEDVQNVRVTDI